MKGTLESYIRVCVWFMMDHPFKLRPDSKDSDNIIPHENVKHFKAVLFTISD